MRPSCYFGTDKDWRVSLVLSRCLRSNGVGHERKKPGRPVAWRKIAIGAAVGWVVVVLALLIGDYVGGRPETWGCEVVAKGYSPPYDTYSWDCVATDGKGRCLAHSMITHHHPAAWSVSYREPLVADRGVARVAVGQGEWEGVMVGGFVAARYRVGRWTGHWYAASVDVELGRQAAHNVNGGMSK